MTRPVLDKFKGCFLGLALGDASGAPFEGGVLERALWRIIGKTARGEKRWTDDTQMSLDLAESLIACGGVDEDDLARRFASGYRWSRGYGAGTAQMLKRVSRGMPWSNANCLRFAGGSMGNGGAMRAPVVGLFFADRTEELKTAAAATAHVTHAHTNGKQGAVLIAVATAAAARSATPHAILEEARSSIEATEFTSRLEIARRWLEAEPEPGEDEVVRRLGNRMTAIESCVTALYVSLRFSSSPFEEMMRFVIRCGGDVDTIGAMSGAIWGAMNGYGALPREQLDTLEQSDRLATTAEALHAASRRSGSPG